MNEFNTLKNRNVMVLQNIEEVSAADSSFKNNNYPPL